MAIYPSLTEIVFAMVNNVCYRAEVLSGGSIYKKGSLVNRYAGGWAVVFPFCKSNSEKIAVRCWTNDIGEQKKRVLSILSYLTLIKSPYFINFRYHEEGLLINGRYHPILTMDWVDEPSLKEYINTNIYNRKAILKIAENFKNMVRYFHEKNIAHGDLSDGNIKVKPDGSLIVLDYDSMYVPDLAGLPDVIKGMKGYQHPARSLNRVINTKLDYFSELIIYLSLLVFSEYPEKCAVYYETNDLLFSQQDYEEPDKSVLIKELLKSNNSEIVDLTRKLIRCLRLNDISQLKPLEEMLKNPINDIADDILSKI